MVSERNKCPSTLMSDISAPELWKNKFLLLTSQWYFVTSQQPTKTNAGGVTSILRFLKSQEWQLVTGSQDVWRSDSNSVSEARLCSKQSSLWGLIHDPEEQRSTQPFLDGMESLAATAEASLGRILHLLLNFWPNPGMVPKLCEILFSP